MDKPIAGLLLVLALAGAFFGGYHLARKQMEEAYLRDIADMELQVEELKKKYSTLAEIIDCESGGKHEAIGDNGRAHGIAQFHRATFEEFAEAAGCEDCRISSRADQLFLLSWAYDNEKLNHWSCYDTQTN